MHYFYQLCLINWKNIAILHYNMLHVYMYMQLKLIYAIYESSEAGSIFHLAKR